MSDLSKDPLLLKSEIKAQTFYGSKKDKRVLLTIVGKPTR